MMPLLLAVLASQAEPELKTRFWTLADGGKERALVTVHGVRLHPFDGDKPDEAVSPGWQAPESTIVRALAAHGSVFGFSYAQNRRVEAVSETLRPHVETLRRDGYGEIVLVGFSAGALVVRQFVEDHPDGGVRRVVQVCPPNAGTDWGKLDRTVRERQEIFVRSMREEDRADFVRDRAAKGIRIPDGVEFAVCMGSFAGGGDGVLSKETQWPPEFREQGIPVERIHVLHGLAMRTEAGAQTIARLASAPQKRWTAEQVEAARKEIFP